MLDPRDLNDRALGTLVRTKWEEAIKIATIPAWGAYVPYRDEAMRRLIQFAATLGFGIEEVSNLPAHVGTISSVIYKTEE